MNANGQPPGLRFRGATSLIHTVQRTLGQDEGLLAVASCRTGAANGADGRRAVLFLTTQRLGVVDDQRWRRKVVDVPLAELRELTAQPGVSTARLTFASEERSVTIDQIPKSQFDLLFDTLGELPLDLG